MKVTKVKLTNYLPPYLLYTLLDFEMFFMSLSPHLIKDSPPCRPGTTWSSSAPPEADAEPSSEPAGKSAFSVPKRNYFEELTGCRLRHPCRTGSVQRTIVWSRTDRSATTARARCLVLTPVVEFTRTNRHGPWRCTMEMFFNLSQSVRKMSTWRRSFPLCPALKVGPQQCFAESKA